MLFLIYFNCAPHHPFVSPFIYLVKINVLRQKDSYTLAFTNTPTLGPIVSLKLFRAPTGHISSFHFILSYALTQTTPPPPPIKHIQTISRQTLTSFITAISSQFFYRSFRDYVKVGVSSLIRHCEGWPQSAP